MPTTFTQEMRDAGLEPMDSAPTDGTVVLVLTSDHELTTAQFMRQHWVLTVCGTWAHDGFVYPVGWQRLPGSLAALHRTS